jgi:1-acyl-sn-glycerol-3-phosphate acyltransferase
MFDGKGSQLGALRPRVLDRLHPFIAAANPFAILGAEHTDAPGGAFLIANHRSNADAVTVLLSCHRAVAGPAKAELFEVPMLGTILTALGAFPLTRTGTDFGAARTIARVFFDGGLVLAFPEGSRSRNGAIMPFSPALARLVAKLEAPIIPVGIAGTGSLLPPGHARPRRVPVAIAYGPRFELTQYYGTSIDVAAGEAAAAFMQARVKDMVDLAMRERRVRYGERGNA